MDFQCWGISHKSTSLEVREKFALNKEEIDKTIASLKLRGAFNNGILLSTCNRTEFYSFCQRAQIKKIDKLLIDSLNSNFALRKNDQYLFSGQDAFIHLLKVMTGIDSMIVGEPDIFGQAKKSFLNSKSLGFLNSELDGIFTGAIKLSKSLRTEAKLSKNPVSIASVVFDEITADSQKVLIIGAGDVGKALTIRLVKKKIKVHVFNRTKKKIADIETNPLSEIKKYTLDADNIVIAASSKKPFLKFENLERNKNKLKIFDLAIPRNLQESINKHPNISLVSLDELSAKIAKNLEGRNTEVSKAETLISEFAAQEFAALKNKKASDVKQKNLRGKLSEIKKIALENAEKNIQRGMPQKEVIKKLADEINAKDSYQISKIIEEISRSTRR
ncbi:MAG: glutamyl-tRNA reductase [Thiotrichales bacterium TMED285]|jgi:glutamyl-tRNA reductase|nr:MAG: glutamyl-tRNA reductase [Thiotrichales bacterium TMED285]|tara:strand:- start:63033 stop:64196 length:1164 start_codon:yes stop_codon:yes gene_type:complete